MWMSNTATVAMLLPISYGILNRLEMNFGLSGPRFSERVLLGLAFSATVGGNMTPIGSPPNVIAIGLLKSIGGVQISFLEWMLVATPFSLILFYFIYRFCIKTIPDSRISLSEAVDIKDYTSFSKEQKYVLIIFCLAVFLWIFPSMIKLLLPEENTLALAITQHLSAPVVSIFLACFLFLVPIFEGKKVLGTHDVSHIDWSSLLLFGSGLSLGQILFKTGGAEFLMSLIKGLSGSLSVGIIIALLILFTIFFTEIASNTATANIILPVVIALGLELELSPTLLALSFAFACNSAFMMPVATPPNAIVFGSQRVEKMAMIRSGLLFNLIGA
jgi:sodium-dependent dicarboxylate transporter 2/3/5